MKIIKTSTTSDKGFNDKSTPRREVSLFLFVVFSFLSFLQCMVI